MASEATQVAQAQSAHNPLPPGERQSSQLSREQKRELRLKKRLERAAQKDSRLNDNTYLELHTQVATERQKMRKERNVVARILSSPIESVAFRRSVDRTWTMMQRNKAALGNPPVVIPEMIREATRVFRKHPTFEHSTIDKSQKASKALAEFRRLAQEGGKDLMQEIVDSDSSSQKFAKGIAQEIFGHELNPKVLQQEKKTPEERLKGYAIKVKELSEEHGQSLSDQEARALAEGFVILAQNMRESGLVLHDNIRTEQTEQAFTYLLQEHLTDQQRQLYQQLVLTSQNRALIMKLQQGKGGVLFAAGLMHFPPLAAGAALALSLGGAVVSAYHRVRYDELTHQINETRGVVKDNSNRKLLQKVFTADWNSIDTSQDRVLAYARIIATSTAISMASFGLGRFIHNPAEFIQDVQGVFQKAGDLLHSTGGGQGVDVSIGSSHDQLASIAGCFVAGTLVLMADGTEKQIERIEVGEMVLSYDEDTKQIQAQKVLALQSPVHTHLVELTFSHGKKTRNTPNHRYLTKEKGWASVDPVLTQERDKVDAHKLEINDIVFAYLDGELTEVEIESITEITQETKTFNLSNIENTHTFFANGIVVHNVKMSTPPSGIDGGNGSGDLTPKGSTYTPPLWRNEGFGQILQRGNPQPFEGTPLSPSSPDGFSADFHHFLGDKLDPKDANSGKLLDDDLLKLRKEVNAINDPRLTHDFDTFVAHRASGTVSQNNIDQVIKDAEFLQVKPHLDAIDADIAGMQSALHNNDMSTYGKLLNDLQENHINALPPQDRGTFLEDIHKLAVDANTPTAADMDKLQQDLDILKATTDPNILHAGDAGDITALENANRYEAMVQNDVIEAKHGIAYNFGDTNIYGDLAGFAGNRIDDALGHVGQTFDNVIGNTIHDHLPSAGSPAEHAANTANSTISLPPGSHQVDIPNMPGVKVELPNGWTIDPHDHIFAMINGQKVDVGALQQIQGHLELQPSNQLAALLHLNSTQPIPLESLSGHVPSLAEVGQYNPADWHWDTQIYQPGLFSHNELTMSVDNGVVHYGGNLTGTNIPSHLDNIPTANDPNLQHIAELNGGHIASSDMVTAVRLNNGQVVLVPMNADGSAQLPPELFQNGHLQNLNYISTALVTDQNGHILHIGDLQHGLPEGAKIVSLASQPYSTPTIGAIDTIHNSATNTSQLFDLNRLVRGFSSGNGFGGPGGGGTPLEIVGHVPGGAAGLAAAGGFLLATGVAGIRGQRNVANSKPLTRLQSLSRISPGYWAGFGATAAVAATARAVRSRRAGRTVKPTPPAAGPQPRAGTPAANPYTGAGVPAAVSAAQQVNQRAGGRARPYNRAVNNLAAQLPPAAGVTTAQHQQGVGHAVTAAQSPAVRNHLAPANRGTAIEHIPYEAAATALVRGVGTNLDLAQEANARAMAEIMMPTAPDGEKAAAADAIRRAAIVHEARHNAQYSTTEERVEAAIQGMQQVDTQLDGRGLAMQVRALRAEFGGTAIIDGYRNTPGLDEPVINAIVAVGVQGGHPNVNLDAGFRAAGIDFRNPRTATSAAIVADVANGIAAAFDRGPELGVVTPLQRRQLIVERLRGIGTRGHLAGAAPSRETLAHVVAKLYPNPRERDAEAVRLVQQVTVGGTFMASSDDLYGIIRGLQAGNVVQDDLRRGFLPAVRKDAGRIPLTPAQEAVVAVMLDETNNVAIDKLNIGLQDLAARRLLPGAAQGERGEQLAGALEGILDVVIPLGLTPADLQARVAAEFPGLNVDEQSLIALSVLQALNASQNPLPPDQQLAFAFAASGIEPRAGGSTPLSAVQTQAIARIGVGIIGGRFAILPGIREAIRNGFKLDDAAAGQVAAEIVNLYDAQGNTDLVAVERGICNLLLPTNFTPETYFAIMHPAGQRLQAIRGASNPITDAEVGAVINAIPSQIPSIEMQVVMCGAFSSLAQTAGVAGVQQIVDRMTQIGSPPPIDKNNPAQRVALVNGLRVFRAQDTDAAAQITEAIGTINGPLDANARRAEVRQALAQAKANGVTDLAELARFAVMVAAPGINNMTFNISEVQAVIEELVDKEGINIDAVRQAMEQLNLSAADRQMLVRVYVYDSLQHLSKISPTTKSYNKKLKKQIDEINEQLTRAIAAAGYPSHAASRDGVMIRTVESVLNGPGILDLGIPPNKLIFD